MSGILSAFIGRVAVVVTDAYFNLTTLLLPGNGTNGAQNNTFLDSSTNNFTITRNGNTTQGTFTPFSQTGWSNSFASGAVLNLNGGTPLTFGTGDFTIEFWVYYNGGLTADVALYDSRDNVSGNGVYPLLYSNTTGKMVYYVSSAARITSTTSLVVGTWYHVALARSGTSTKLFINGTQEGSTYTDSNNYLLGTNRPSIGAAGISLGADPLNGYMSNVRVVKGTAVYTSNFTPPTSPLTAITNTSLLTCQSNRFIDNSTNAFAITVTSSPSVQAFSPFAPTAAYDATTVGGSGYFDGTGDYLSVASNAAFQFGTGDFTVEAWWYPTTISSTYQTIAGVWVTGNLGWILQARSTDVLISISSGFFTVTGSATIVANQWYHVAASRNGTTVRVFLNGTQLNTGTSSANGTASTALQIGRNEDGNQQYVNGYLSSLRIVKGQGLATGSFTPPTAPVTTTAVGWTGANAASSITGTVSLLTNFTNAGITDATAKNVLETVGNAQISTTQSKFGGSSMYFDGTGDSIVANSGARTLEMLTGDFTIECWIRFASVGNGQIISGLTGANTLYWQYYTSQLQFGQNNVGSIAATNWSPSANTWYHVAVTRSGTTVRQFVDGVQLGSNATSSASFPNGPVSIGTGGAGDLNGFIDDLRVTKGYARYTANFTAPTAAFPLQ